MVRSNNKRRPYTDTPHHTAAFFARYCATVEGTAEWGGELEVRALVRVLFRCMHICMYVCVVLVSTNPVGGHGLNSGTYRTYTRFGSATPTIHLYNIYRTTHYHTIC